MSEANEPAQSVVAKPKRPPAKKPKKPRQLPLFHVILLDDNDHTHEYVIEMVRALFGHSETRAAGMAKEVHETGRSILLTTHKERAELKRDQIHAYGKDHRVATCQGSMSACIEPAE
jgi:ATP-dependent Clp protease adaptor protein ClpS